MTGVIRDSVNTVTGFRKLRFSVTSVFLQAFVFQDFSTWHGSCNRTRVATRPAKHGPGGREPKDLQGTAAMNNRNVQNGLVLAGALVVLFSLMFATSIAVNQAPPGL